MSPARSPDMAEAAVVERALASEADTVALAHELSLVAHAGTIVLLRGELGAGKTTLARALIRALSATDPQIEVPSPSFALLHSYAETRIPVAHIDLYRVTSADEIRELGLEDLLPTYLLVVEWPDLLPANLANDVLEIVISGRASGRRARLRGHGSWARALRRMMAVSNFLAGSDWRSSRRRFLEGDASFRRYETLERDGDTAILMDMPARPDGPPVKDGKPYSAIAHLAEDIGAVLAVNRELVERGYSAPRTLASDVGAGLAIVENLGSRVFGRMMAAGEDMREPLHAAVEVLADMARHQWPAKVPIPGGTHLHLVPPYDREAQLIEVDLLTSWYFPHLLGRPAPGDLRDEFLGLWTDLLPSSQPSRPTWTLRDYHSPNLLWMPERHGVRRVGLIDTQDCVLGHPAYDLVSLLQDARVDIGVDLADALFDDYCRLASDQPSFDRSAMAAAFALLGAQRATKILGIFARLSKRDGKHGYLRHIPRVSRYLERNLQHPLLEKLKAWFDRYLPESLRQAEKRP